MRGQASLELLVLVAAAMAVLMLLFSSVSATYEAGREVAALRSAQALLAGIDHACQRAEVSGAPQRVESAAPTPVRVTKESGLLVAQFKSNGRQVRVSRATSWCEGNWAVKPGGNIMVLPKQSGD